MTLNEILERSITERTLKKLVLSRAADKSVRRCEGRLVKLGGEVYLQLETFHADGKATHQNLRAEAEAIVETARTAASLVTGEERSFSQLNLLDTGGECEVKVSSKGKLHIMNRIRTPDAASGGMPSDTPQKGGFGSFELEIAEHDRGKSYILEGGEAFLTLLGVSDKNGRVYDRRRAKYRQINRFLELVSDVYGSLPAEGTLHVCDLCCGKAYLTFAVYWYLTAVRGREVEMYGVDRKADVISYCADSAEKLGYTGLHFVSGDINEFEPERAPDLVVSLHACDIATDIVLANAVRWKTGVILSTPCCHHEMMRQISSPELGFITEHSILKQKLCDAATDALRAKRLEIEGYSVTALELIDPEETPKNVMLRAVRRGISEKKAAALRTEYDAALAFLGAEPYLDRLLGKE